MTQFVRETSKLRLLMNISHGVLCCLHPLNSPGREGGLSETLLAGTAQAKHLAVCLLRLREVRGALGGAGGRRGKQVLEPGGSSDSSSTALSSKHTHAHLILLYTLASLVTTAMASRLGVAAVRLAAASKQAVQVSRQNCKCVLYFVCGSSSWLGAPVPRPVLGPG